MLIHIQILFEGTELLFSDLEVNYQIFRVNVCLKTPFDSKCLNDLTHAIRPEVEKYECISIWKNYDYVDDLTTTTNKLPYEQL